jgi:hypothetical protein
VRRKLALFAGATIGAAAGILWRRGQKPAAPAEPDERTEELRRKLAEAREAEPAAAPEPKPVPEPEPEITVDLEESRRRVHDEARAAMDEMERSGEDER